MGFDQGDARGDRVAGSCAACGVALAGRYCHACGQDTMARPAPLRQMAVEVATSYSPIDGKLARTLAVLVLRPARLLEAYRAGAGSLYVTPLKLFVATTALFLAVMNFSGTTLYQATWKAIPGQTQVAVHDPVADEVVIEGARYEERWLQPHIDPPVDESVMEALRVAAATATDPAARASFLLEITTVRTEELMNQRLSAWLPNLMWLLMPAYAALLAMFFGRKRLFLEHVIFGMWAHAATFMMMMGVAFLNGRGLNLPAWAVAVPYLVYFVPAASGYYGVSLLGALWRGVVHLTLYCLLILLPVAMIIYATGIDWAAFNAWLAA